MLGKWGWFENSGQTDNKILYEERTFASSTDLSQVWDVIEPLVLIQARIWWKRDQSREHFG